MNNYNQLYPPNNVYANQTWPYQQTQQVSQYPFYNQYQQQNLNGKYVDSVDVVKATEVPMGATGIFPKADMSEVYIKTWNPNGTTTVITYKPFEDENKTPQEKFKMEDILAQISALNEKVDKLLGDLGS